jgi:hypothetical protein
MSPRYCRSGTTLDPGFWPPQTELEHIFDPLDSPTHSPAPSLDVHPNHGAPASLHMPAPTMTTYDEYGVPVGAYSEPDGLIAQAWRTARAFYLYRIRPIYTAWKRGDWSFRRLFTLVNVLVVVWWAVLYWGERGTFNGAVESCNWEGWEKWVCVYRGIQRDAWLTECRKLAQPPIDSSSSPTRSSSIRTRTLVGHGPSIRSHTSTPISTYAAHTLVCRRFCCQTLYSS